MHDAAARLLAATKTALEAAGHAAGTDLSPEIEALEVGESN